MKVRLFLYLLIALSFKLIATEELSKNEIKQVERYIKALDSSKASKNDMFFMENVKDEAFNDYLRSRIIKLETTIEFYQTRLNALEQNDSNDAMQPFYNAQIKYTEMVKLVEKAFEEYEKANKEYVDASSVTVVSNSKDFENLVALGKNQDLFNKIGQSKELYEQAKNAYNQAHLASEVYSQTYQDKISDDFSNSTKSNNSKTKEPIASDNAPYIKSTSKNALDKSLVLKAKLEAELLAHQAYIKANNELFGAINNYIEAYRSLLATK